MVRHIRLAETGRIRVTLGQSQRARGAHVTAVGSDMPHKQELNPRGLAGEHGVGRDVPLGDW